MTTGYPHSRAVQDLLEAEAAIQHALALQTNGRLGDAGATGQRIANQYLGRTS